ncbi:MAG: RNB domain-containing ribonuclease [Mariprofundales bacterium]
MKINNISPNSLVLYRHQAALVMQVAAKHLMIKLAASSAKKVRHKDVILLHSGPVQKWPLPVCDINENDLLEAWELLQGSNTNLTEICELACSESSAAQAWYVWQWLEEQPYFTGSPDNLQAQSEQTVQAIFTEAKQKRDAEQTWSALLLRIKNADLLPQDAKEMRDVELVANEQRAQSRILQALHISQTPQDAYRLLLRCDHWSETHNPWPARHGISIIPSESNWPKLPEEQRLDLTHLAAFAIDDIGNQDPDDAISVDGIDEDNATYWIHIADVAAIVQPNSSLDIEARTRAATLYLPECTVPMLPVAAVQQLGLGLHDISPALSIAVKLGNDGGIVDCHVHASNVRVQRLSYNEVSAAIVAKNKPILLSLWRIAQLRQQYRLAHAALQLDFPEVKICANNGVVTIKSLPSEISRTMVSEWMLMAGEAIAWLAAKEGFALPHSSQYADLPTEAPKTLSEMYACRQKLSPSSRSATAEAHAALGLPAYVQCTSPLRRYGDLLAHQQLRAWLADKTLQSSGDINTRLAEYSETAKAVRYCERGSNMHWTLYYLQQHPDWSGEAIILDQRGRKMRVSIASLGLELWLNAKGEYTSDMPILLTQPHVSLPEASARFKVAIASQNG